MSGNVAAAVLFCVISWIFPFTVLQVGLVIEYFTVRGAAEQVREYAATGAILCWSSGVDCWVSRNKKMDCSGQTSICWWFIRHSAKPSLTVSLRSCGRGSFAVYRGGQLRVLLAVVIC